MQVLDATSGEDVTGLTLTQIIWMTPGEQPTGLPLELLRQLILTSDRVGQEFILWYLKSAQEAYQRVHTKSTEWPLRDAGRSTLAYRDGPQLHAASEPRRPRELYSNKELDHLRQRISELEARLDAKPNKNNKKKTAAPKGAKLTKRQGKTQ